MVPYSYIRDGAARPARLGRDEYELISRCDGKTELETSPLLRELLAKGLIRQATEGEADGIRPARSYNNRCVPNLSLTMTTYCNFNCRHCYLAADNDVVRQEMSLEDCKRIIDDAADCGVLHFKLTGGEPMMHRGFMDVVEYIYEKGMAVSHINTNGYYFTPYTLDRLRAIDRSIHFNVSFDGVGFHDWMRGREGAEKDALDKMRLCMEYGFYVRPAMTLNRVNLPALHDTIDTLEDMGFEEFRVIRTSETPRWAIHAGDATLPFEEHYDALVEASRYYASKERKMRLNMWHFAILDPRSRTWVNMPVACASADYSPTLPSCVNARENITVLPDGSVYPCVPGSGVYEGNGITFENALETGLKPILQDSRLLSVSCAGTRQIAEHDPKCGSCRYFKQCLGGCRIFALGLNHDLMTHDPSKCVYFEKRYDLKLKDALTGWRCMNGIDCG